MAGFYGTCTCNLHTSVRQLPTLTPQMTWYICEHLYAGVAAWSGHYGKLCHWLNSHL